MQAATIGELHHAIKQKKITIADIHAELGMIIAGKRPGRESDKEIIIFDSTGTALQDVAAAAIVYEKALQAGAGIQLDIASAGHTAAFRNNQKDITSLSSFFPFR